MFTVIVLYQALNDLYLLCNMHDTIVFKWHCCQTSKTQMFLQWTLGNYRL